MASTHDQRPLETGWLPDTPIDDTVFRRFVHNQGDANAVLAQAHGGRTDRTDDVFLADTATPIAYFNQAIPTRPLAGPADPALDVIEQFFAGTGRPASLLSLWPTPDLGPRGWKLVGHPAVVLRAPAAVTHRPAPGVEVTPATSAEDYAAAEYVAVHGYPLEEGRGLPPGAIFPPALADTDLAVHLGRLDGEVVGIGNRFSAHGLVNLCLGATLATARRRGVWQALVWARVAHAPDLPAIAYTSDDSRPSFLRMGFLPITRFTIWERPG